MKREINTWPIDVDQNGAEYTAYFAPEDFERWFLAGADRTDRFTDQDVDALVENCIYISQAESRRMVQSVAELRSDIEGWKAKWNERYI